VSVALTRKHILIGHKSVKGFACFFVGLADGLERRSGMDGCHQRVVVTDWPSWLDVAVRIDHAIHVR